MSDIDQIALDVVKAIGNIDPDKLPGGRTQAIAQAQVLARDAISEETKSLRQQLEQAQARVAELEAETEWLIATGSKLTKAATLRKQAEAVESAAKVCIDTITFYKYAQRLRQQAGEIEKAGGGQ